MKPKIVKGNLLKERLTPEQCFLFENWGFATHGDHAVSVARARVKYKVTTKAHHLQGVQEIYLITQGKGKVYMGDMKPQEVAAGDIVVIPAGTSQKIENIGEEDLIFYCICTPAFTQDVYIQEET